MFLELSYYVAMAGKSPRKPSGKKPGKTLKEKRAAKRLKRTSSASLFETRNQRRR
jgi:hypothetical protein